MISEFQNEYRLPFYHRWCRKWKRFVTRWSNLLKHGFTLGFWKKISVFIK